MQGLHVDQTQSLKRLGLKQELSLRILNQGFIDLSSYLQEIESENPFLDIDRKKDIASFELVKYRSSPSSGFDASSVKSSDESLQEYLTRQIGVARLDKKTAQIALRLAAMIDTSGYFLIPTRDAAEELGEDEAVIVSVLENVVQRLEPPGVGARDISECMLLQLSPQEHANLLLTDIIRFDLMLVAQNKLGAIAKKRGAGLDAVKRCCDRLRRLNPKPGGSFGKDIIEYVFPDIIVESRNGRFIVRLSEEDIFSVSCNRAYALHMMEEGGADAQAFAEQKLRQAVWLCECLRRRHDTLQKLGNHLIKAQPYFFEQGRGHLLPMTMKEMAASIGVHESTICRAVAGKYVQCRWGVFPLKSFFSPNVGGISAEALKKRIVEIISSEPKLKPFSDQRICDMLLKEQMNIARRTVAKYREQCHIPGASRRKQV